MRAVIEGYLGREWMPQAGGSSTRVGWGLAAATLACGATVGCSPGPRVIRDG
jgi:hypothetical protein